MKLSSIFKLAMKSDGVLFSQSRVGIDTIITIIEIDETQFEIIEVQMMYKSGVKYYNFVCTKMIDDNKCILIKTIKDTIQQITEKLN